MELANQQAQAADLVGAWLKNRDKPYFYLGGFAGTGKTTIAKYLMGLQDGDCAVAAYTGKAASVLNKKGLPASTIHSLIYKVSRPDDQVLESFKKRMAAAKGPALEELKKELKEYVRPKFTLNEESPLYEVDLIIIDEVSMVGEEMGKDLLSFHVPILVLGDPGQLPPVTGEGFFTSGDPDFLLTEIHRQAAGNPIINLAAHVRKGNALRAGAYGSSKVVFKTKFEPSAYEVYDQVICGRNATRKTTNSLIRDRFNRISSQPEVGEKIICLRNNKDIGILNGTQWYVTKVDDAGIYLDLEILDELTSEKKPLTISTHPFDADLPNMFYRDRQRFEEFDFGYAITCHKSQGSQWPKVLIHNESWCFRENSAKWLYTALTRAEEQVLVCL